MTMRSQCTSVDPKAGVVWSHMPESHKNRGCSKVMPIGNNNLGMSTSEMCSTGWEGA